MISMRVPQPVDVICQQNRDGTMIPLRVRLTDEEGATQTYTIKEYKDLSHQGDKNDAGRCVCHGQDFRV